MTGDNNDMFLLRRASSLLWKHPDSESNLTRIDNISTQASAHTGTPWNFAHMPWTSLTPFSLKSSSTHPLLKRALRRLSAPALTAESESTSSFLGVNVIYIITLRVQTVNRINHKFSPLFLPHAIHFFISKLHLPFDSYGYLKQGCLLSNAISTLGSDTLLVIRSSLIRPTRPTTSKPSIQFIIYLFSYVGFVPQPIIHHLNQPCYLANTL